MKTPCGLDMIGRTYLAGWMSFAQVDVFNERDVIIRMPIQRVEDAIERHRFQHLIDRSQHIQPVLQQKDSTFIIICCHRI